MGDKTTGNAYITGLYLDIETLNNNVASYKDILVQLAPAKDGTMIVSDEAKERLKRIVPETRFLLVRSFIKISSLQKISEFEKFVSENKEKYKELINETVPTFENLLDYVVGLNQAFIAGISNEFFSTVQDIYSDYDISQNFGGGNGTTNQ